MANFGLTHLSVVEPFEEHWREARSAVGAPQVLANARQCATLAEAVADCSLVAGTGTLTYRRPEQPVVSPAQAAALTRRERLSGGAVAIVFGPEKHGLTREDLSYCHLLVEIPTDPVQPSMNLGQAVAVSLYELAARETAAESPLSAPTLPALSATGGNLDRLARMIEQTMQIAGYSPNVMQQANRHDLRLLLRRLALNQKDTRRVLGLFRRILWSLKSERQAPFGPQ